MQLIYSDPTFQMACDQFALIADYLQISRDLRDRLMYPKRSLVVAVPVRMDDGSTQVFEGYRVQHTLAMGPTKGGTRFGTTVTIGEMAALAMWMSWKCALTGLPYGGGKGGVPGRSAEAFRKRVGTIVQALYAGDDPVHRPAHRYHGA